MGPASDPTPFQVPGRQWIRIKVDTFTEGVTCAGRGPEQRPPHAPSPSLPTVKHPLSDSVFRQGIEPSGRVSVFPRGHDK